MKKIAILIIILLTPIMSSCSVQEKMSPDIFIERFIKLNHDNIFIETTFRDNKKHILFFSDNNKSEYACELMIDDNENVKKICLACTDTSKTDSFKNYSKKIIETYAPNEDSTAIISKLFNENWDYETTQWYKYSSVISDKGLFFSIENLRFATESDAALTLKHNDITFP